MKIKNKLTDKIKNKLIDKITNIYKYIGIGIAGGITLTNITNAQTTTFTGKITDGETYQGIPNIKVKFYLINQNKQIIDSTITWTNQNGEYTTNEIILHTENNTNTNIKETIKYYGLTKHGTTQKITEKEIQKIREQTKK
ncbi:MAG: hypothetical protein QXK76_04150 [Candidatus Woesearchaeota archaeon]